MKELNSKVNWELLQQRIKIVIAWAAPQCRQELEDFAVSTVKQIMEAKNDEILFCRLMGKFVSRIHEEAGKISQDKVGSEVVAYLGRVKVFYQDWELLRKTIKQVLDLVAPERRWELITQEVFLNNLARAAGNNENIIFCQLMAKYVSRIHDEARKFESFQDNTKKAKKQKGIPPTGKIGSEVAIYLERVMVFFQEQEKKIKEDIIMKARLHVKMNNDWINFKRATV